MDCKIIISSCFEHKISHDKSYIFDQKFDTHFELLNQNYSFVVSSFQSGIITLMLTESIITDIEFFCADNVNLTIRLIFLFVQKAAVRVSIFMCGSLSNVTIFGMCVLAEKQSIVIKTVQIHCGENCRSKLFLQGLLTDFSSLQYDGLIHIQEKASGTYALQNNKNILLSSTASVISIPNIEVLNHDVQCYHGSAVGKFVAQQMEYMQSRGLSQLMIKKLLVQALFADVLQNYEKREFILQKIYEKI